MQLTSLASWELYLPNLDHTRSRYALGLFFILLQCIVWIAAAVITQYVYEENDDTSPFLMTYLGMSLMAPLFLPLEIYNDWRARKIWKESRRKDTENDYDKDDPLNTSLETADSFEQELNGCETANCLINVMYIRSKDLADQNQQIKPWNHKKHMLAALQIAPAMFIADYCFNCALRHTSVTSTTVIVSSQNVVVFMLAVLTRIEGFTYIKLGGVLISMIGVALTTLHDTSDDLGIGELSGNAIIGDIFALVAAIMYGVYAVQVRLFCPQNEDLYKMPLLMGYIGLFVAVPCAPYAVYLASKVWHELTGSIMACIALKGLLDFVLTDYLLFRSVVLTSATVATVGLGLTIPMAFAADLIFQPETNISSYSVIGAVLVGLGFISVLDKDEVEKEGEENEKELPTCSSSSSSSKDGDVPTTSYVAFTVPVS